MRDVERAAIGLKTTTCHRGDGLLWLAVLPWRERAMTATGPTECPNAWPPRSATASWQSRVSQAPLAFAGLTAGNGVSVAHVRSYSGSSAISAYSDMISRKRGCHAGHCRRVARGFGCGAARFRSSCRGQTRRTSGLREPSFPRTVDGRWGLCLDILEAMRRGTQSLQRTACWFPGVRRERR